MRKGLLASAAVLVMTCCMAAHAESVLLTIEGIATPYSYDGYSFCYDDPFDVTLQACLEIDCYSETPDPSGVTLLSAAGTVVWWEVTDPIETVHYDAAGMLDGWWYTDNWWGADGVVLDVGGVPVPLDVYGEAYVGAMDEVSSEGFDAYLSVWLDGSDLLAYGFQDYWTYSYDYSEYYEEGWEFDGVVTDVQLCDCVIPEPASLSLVGLGIGALGLARRLRKLG